MIRTEVLWAATPVRVGVDVCSGAAPGEFSVIVGAAVLRRNVFLALSPWAPEALSCSAWAV